LLPSLVVLSLAIAGCGGSSPGTTATRTTATSASAATSFRAVVHTGLGTIKLEWPVKVTA
jgi:hypothetical protein